MSPAGQRHRSYRDGSRHCRCAASRGGSGRPEGEEAGARPCAASVPAWFFGSAPQSGWSRGGRRLIRTHLRGSLRQPEASRLPSSSVRCVTKPKRLKLLGAGRSRTPRAPRCAAARQARGCLPSRRHDRRQPRALRTALAAECIRGAPSL